jgi:hypothetical protein
MADEVPGKTTLISILLWAFATRQRELSPKKALANLMMSDRTINIGVQRKR